MQLYGGQVQYYYFTAIAVGVYALLHAIAAATRGWRGVLRPIVEQVVAGARALARGDVPGGPGRG